MSSPISIRNARLDDLSLIVDFNDRLATESEGKKLDRGTPEEAMRGRSRNGHENDEVNPVHAGLILAETTPPRRWVVAAGSGAPKTTTRRTRVPP